MPGILYHILATFRILFENWKLFLPLALIMSVVAVATIAGLNETSVVFSSVIFLVLWLTTIFILRQRMAGHQLKLRDALYNAMTPLIQTFVVFLAAVFECLPIFIVVIAYSTALETDLFALPFYAFLFLVFAGVMILLSAYLLSSTLIALIAVSAPGIYPVPAFKAATELMMGRKVKFVLRLIALLLFLGAIWAAIMVPLAMLLAVAAPVALAVIEILACFSSIYVTAYLYLYYRWMLDYDTKGGENDKK